jgi:hypothetical protein
MKREASILNSENLKHQLQTKIWLNIKKAGKKMWKTKSKAEHFP